jgi:hydrogenase nickel incorporation protein HypA/HybF
VPEGRIEFHEGTVHELTIARNIVEIVSCAARDAEAIRVLAVRVRIGVLTAVVPTALASSFEIAALGTVLEGSRLEVNVSSAIIHCSVCSRDAGLHDITRFACPGCGTPTSDLRSGRELEVESIEVL